MWVSCVSIKTRVAVFLYPTHSMFLYFILLSLQGVFFFFLDLYRWECLHSVSVFTPHLPIWLCRECLQRTRCKVDEAVIFSCQSCLFAYVFLCCRGLSSLGHHVCHYLPPFTQLQLPPVYSYFIRNL